MTVWIAGALFVAFLATAGGQAEAGIVTGSSTNVTVLSSAPSDLRQGVYENATVQAFAEVIGGTLSSSVSVDHDGTPNDGTTPVYNKNSKLISGTLPAGTSLDAWFFHYDPVGTTVTVINVTITFDQPIIGVILKTNSLASTDSVFALSGTTYLPNTARGLELGTGSSNDTLTISANRRVATLQLGAGTNLDHFRILTTPEPGTFFLMGAGLLGMGLFVRRRRSKRVPTRS